jgi:predicted permease
LVLLAGAGLMVKSGFALSQVNPGFDASNVLMMEYRLPRNKYPSGPAQSEFHRQVVENVRGIPGVIGVSSVRAVPLGGNGSTADFSIVGKPEVEPGKRPRAIVNPIDPDFLSTLRIPLLRGRDFAETDRIDSPPVCIVNESFARRFWPGQDPLGKRVKHSRLDNSRPWYTVVGVVADTKAIADPHDGEVVGTVALPLSRWLAIGGDEMTFVVESKGDAKSIAGDLRQALARADQRLAAYTLVSLDQAAAESWVTERFLFVLVSLFGALGLVLASIGVYGLLALQVARRTREFGIRLALGATARALIRLVATQGLRLLALGFFVGGIAAWAAAKMMHHQWPEIPASDPLIWIGAIVVLSAGVALASWLPARRASRVDPMIALRAE